MTRLAPVNVGADEELSSTLEMYSSQCVVDKILSFRDLLLQCGAPLNVASNTTAWVMAEKLMISIDAADYRISRAIMEDGALALALSVEECFALCAVYDAYMLTAYKNMVRDRPAFKDLTNPLGA